MPDYRYTGEFPRVLTGLQENVNANLYPAQPPFPPSHSTIVARPGDTLHTDEPYPHPELEELTEPAPVDPATEPAPEPGPDLPTGVVVADDPAHTAMTAEGAPAPATE